jgi:hypothetical protein
MHVMTAKKFKINNAQMSDKTSWSHNRKCPQKINVLIIKGKKRATDISIKLT